MSQAFGAPINNFGQIQRYIGDGYAMTEVGYARCAFSQPDNNGAWVLFVVLN